MSDTSFERAEAKPVPDNWHDQAREFRERRDILLASDGYGMLQDPRKPIVTSKNTILTKQQVVPSVQMLFEFFETVLTAPDVSKSVHKLCVAGEKMSRGEPYVVEHEDSLTLRYFSDWWFDKYTDFPAYMLRDLSEVSWLIVTDPLFFFFRNRDVKKSYEMLAKEHEYQEKITSDMNAKMTEVIEDGEV